MPRCKVGTENGAGIEIHYEDHGSGQPVVLIHGFPLSGTSWERQERELLDAGYRVISYDRRGFGRSSQPTLGYDYDTFAADLNVLLEHLDLRDVILVGFSMGTGEVTRFLGRFGSVRVRKAVLLAAIPPFLLKRDDNPEGVDGQVFEGLKAAVVKDRYAFFKDFLDNFSNVDELAPERISEQAWQAEFQVAAASSAYATYACIDSWLSDFRRDLPKIDVPTLIVHGTADRILPIGATADRLPALIADCRLVRVEGGPHNIGWTHPDEVNRALLEFIAEPDTAAVAEAPAADSGERITEVLDFPWRDGHVNAIRVDYEPGGFTRGTHRHPGGAYVYVIEGSVTFGVDQGEPFVLKAGESFYEPPGALHSVSRNASDAVPASLIAFFVLADGETPTVYDQE